MSSITSGSDWSRVQILIWTVCTLLTVSLARLVLEGVSGRRRFLRMRSQGLPVLEPYSPVWGHLKAVQLIRKDLPKDAHFAYTSNEIAQNWQKYFPKAHECPPLVYLDVWPLRSEAIIVLLSPDLCAQVTQDKPLPRSSLVRWAMLPLTEGLDLVSMEADDHKAWRGKLKPAFSPRNIASTVDEIIEKIDTYVGKLKQNADQNGGWGDVFTAYDLTVSLTFDIIAKFAVGLDLHEQVEGPTQVVKAMRRLIEKVKGNSLKNRLERLMPWWRKEVASDRETLRHALLPKVKSIMSQRDKVGDGKQTVVEHALRDMEAGSLPSGLLMETIISNVKNLLFAGHDTTSQTICWAFWELYRHPEALDKMRKEHNSLLGETPDTVRDTILQRPSILHDLRYTTAIIKETLRIHNIGLSIRSSSESNLQLTHNGQQYPAHNALIQTSPSAINIREDIWPRPMDFVPQRFLVDKEHELYPAKNAFRPFELGNTRCIGEELAMMEIKLVLVFVFGHLDMTVDYDAWRTKHSPDITSVALNGDVAYRCGDGIGFIKDYLPIRVALASKN